MSPAKRFPRRAGILLHPTSLPGRYGIGNIGADARRLIPWLAEAGQQLWQMCPLGPTGYGDSPYQALSAFAGNPLLVSLDDLVDEGLLVSTEVADAECASGSVDYARVIDRHVPLLEQAALRLAARSKNDPLQKDFAAFCEREQSWLEDWVLYAALKDEAGGAPWNEWDRDLAHRNPAALEQARDRLRTELHIHRCVQFLFARQWHRLREHARGAGIAIIGDLPIFAAYDSAECWARPDLFQLDDDGVPVAVAGVPPDYFSTTGQRWGNPLYDWSRHESEQFAWWISLLTDRFRMFDIMRIDHFRGFEAYWRIPWGAPTAESGEWVPAPGEHLFQRVRDVLGSVAIIAEDLGVITPGVVHLMNRFGFPGMKILQFGFDSGDDNDYLPHDYSPHSVVYTGTHDNNTVCGWVENAAPDDLDLAMRYMNSDGQEVSWDFVRTALASVSDTAIIPMQDVLGLGAEARMNIPGTLGGNWQWRMRNDDLNDDGRAARLRELTTLYGRTSL